MPRGCQLVGGAMRCFAIPHRQWNQPTANLAKTKASIANTSAPTTSFGRVVRLRRVASTEAMLSPGIINREFNDIKAIMCGIGHALMGTASGLLLAVAESCA